MKRILLAGLAVSFCLDLNLCGQEAGTPDLTRNHSRQYWNRFRGPNGSGVMKDAQVPVRFGPNLNVAWKIPMDEGPSSPVIWADRIFLTAISSRKANELEAICIDRVSGKEMWRDSVTDPHPRTYFSFGSPVTPTPAVDADHVYVCFPTYGIICYDHDGARVWDRRLQPTKHAYGMAVSPILYRDTLILDGGTNISRLMAVDPRTGETVWKQNSPAFRPGWSTPIIWRRPEIEELVALGSHRLTAFDPANGEAKWWATGFTGEVIGVPVIGEGLLFASSGQAGQGSSKWNVEGSWKIMIREYDRDGDGKIQRAEMKDGLRLPLRLELDRDAAGAAWPIPPENVDKFLANWDKDHDGELSKTEWEDHLSSFGRIWRPALLAIRPGASGDAYPDHVAWKYERGIPEVPSPLYCQGNIYLIRNGGFLTCINAKNGEARFQQERTGAEGQYIASPVAAGDKIIVASERGVVTVLQAGDNFEVLARNDFNEPILATPALAGNRLYLRTARHVYAIGK